MYIQLIQLISTGGQVDLMASYDLKSLKLPRLFGKMLTAFANIAANPTTRPLIIGSLLENGGIPKLRKLKFPKSLPSFL
jgi:hypothetical protein